MFPILLLSSLLISSSLCTWTTRFFSDTYFSSSIQDQHLIPPLGPCLPCNYIFTFGSSQATFQINSQKNGLYRFQLDILPNATDSFIVFDRTYNFQGIGRSSSNHKNISINIQITILAHDGMQYQYIIQIKQLGLLLDKTQLNNPYLLYIYSIIYAIILCLVIPMNQKQIQKSMVDMFKRTCLLSMYFYSQLTIIICATQTIILIFYIYYSSTIIKKIISAAVFGSSFFICLVFATFSIAIIQKQLNKYLQNSSKYKNVFMIIILFISLISYPLFIVFIHKGIWFFYFSIIGLVTQFFISNHNKIMPCPRFITLYALALVYLLLQTDQYPIANFHQLSIFQMVIWLFFIIGVILIAKLLLQKTKKQQNVADMFSLTIPQKQPKQNEIKQQISQDQKIINAKSQIQLEEDIVIS